MKTKNAFLLLAILTAACSMNGCKWHSEALNECLPACDAGLVCYQGTCVDGSKPCGQIYCKADEACFENECYPEERICKDGIPCPPGWVCQAGACVNPNYNPAACSTLCPEDTQCYLDKENNRELCIYSNVICTSDEGTEICQSNETCDNGTCTAINPSTCTEICDFDEVCFYGECQDSKKICGKDLCTEDETCLNGVCVLSDTICGGTLCLEDQTCCNQICVSNSRICGEKSLCNICQGTELCVDNVCRVPGSNPCDLCQTGEVCINSTCIATSRLCAGTTTYCNVGEVCISNVCGPAQAACGQSFCKANEICKQSQCFPIFVPEDPCNACDPETETCINKTCVSKFTSECEDTCAPNETCVENNCIETNKICGSDICEATEECLNGICSPLPTDDCNNTCTSEELCRQGVCIPKDKICGTDVCENNEICQNGVCVEPYVDSCNNTCTTEQTCIDGECINNSQICGQYVCDPLQTCENGKCTWDECHNSCDYSSETCFKLNSKYICVKTERICDDDVCEINETCHDDGSDMFCVLTEALCGDTLCDASEACYQEECYPKGRVCNDGKQLCDQGLQCFEETDCVEADRICNGGKQLCNLGYTCFQNDCVNPEMICGDEVCTSSESCIENKCVQKTEQTVKMRIMAANITSGNYQSYDPGHGTRIFLGLKPDIVLIQEFRYKQDSNVSDLAEYVASTFGPEFDFCVGNGQIPNGIISRWPIRDNETHKCKYWESNVVSNRNWDYAYIDIPGEKDLVAVSLHLHTSKNTKEMPVLKEKLAGVLNSGDYYMVIGGDFNTDTRASTENNFKSILDAWAPYPADQEGNPYTNIKRTKSYDWLLASHDFAKLEVPLVIGQSTYTNGLVFDSRVYTPLSEVAPIEAADSKATNMQHLPVLRDFSYSYTTE